MATVAASGVLLVLIVVFAITTARQATRIYSEISTSMTAIGDLGDELNALRSDMYLSGIYIRNQLLNSVGPWSEDQRESLSEVHATIQRRLKRIDDELTPHEQDPMLAALRKEIDAYWQIVGPAADNPSAAAANGVSIREELRAHRESALSIAEQIEKINE